MPDDESKSEVNEKKKPKNKKAVPPSAPAAAATPAEAPSTTSPVPDDEQPKSEPQTSTAKKSKKKKKKSAPSSTETTANPEDAKMLEVARLRGVNPGWTWKKIAYAVGVSEKQAKKLFDAHCFSNADDDDADDDNVDDDCSPVRVIPGDPDKVMPLLQTLTKPSWQDPISKLSLLMMERRYSTMGCRAGILDALEVADDLWRKLNEPIPGGTTPKDFACWHFSFTLDAIEHEDGKTIPNRFEFEAEKIGKPPGSGGFPGLWEGMDHVWYRHEGTFGGAKTEINTEKRMKKMADWLSDCYCLRLHDEVRWAPGRAFYLSLPLGNGKKVFPGRRGAYLAAMFSHNELKTPDGRLLQRRVLVMDCLLFVLLCKARGQLPPEESENFVAGYLLPALAKKVCHPFSKEAAIKKWGEENVFSSSPSLRRTGEQVYGVSLTQLGEAGETLEARRNAMGDCMKQELTMVRKVFVDPLAGAFDRLTINLLQKDVVPAFGNHLGFHLFGDLDTPGEPSKRTEILARVGGEERWAWFFHNIRDHDFCAPPIMEKDRSGDISVGGSKNAGGTAKDTFDVGDCTPLVFRTQLKELESNLEEETGLAEVVVRFSPHEPSRLPAWKTLEIQYNTIHGFLRLVKTQFKALVSEGWPGTRTKMIDSQEATFVQAIGGIVMLTHLDDCIAFASSNNMPLVIKAAKTIHNMFFHHADPVPPEVVTVDHTEEALLEERGAVEEAGGDGSLSGCVGGGRGGPLRMVDVSAEKGAFSDEDGAVEAGGGGGGLSGSVEGGGGKKDVGEKGAVCPGGLHRGGVLSEEDSAAVEAGGGGFADGNMSPEEDRDREVD